LNFHINNADCRTVIHTLLISFGQYGGGISMEIKVKPIRPTKVIVNSEEEYKAFVDFAHNVNQPYDEIIEKVKERQRNHVRFLKRRRHED